MGRLTRARMSVEEHALSGLAWAADCRGRGKKLPAHLVTGMAGETAAFFYLRGRGYIVVARRWLSGSLPGDIDLVAWQGAMLCFVEVKTRTARDATPAEAAVDAHKRHTLRRLARQYIRQLPGETAPPARFDVLSVYLAPGEKRQFQHFTGAFGWDEREDAQI